MGSAMSTTKLLALAEWVRFPAKGSVDVGGVGVGFVEDDGDGKVGVDAPGDDEHCGEGADDGVGDGDAGNAVPQNRGLSLVGDADGRDCINSTWRLCHGLPGSRELRIPDCLGVMFDVPGSGIDLRVLLLRLGDDQSGVIDDQRTTGSRSLIQGEDISFQIGASVSGGEMRVSM